MKRIEEMLANLPDHQPPPDWQARVMEGWDQHEQKRRHRRRIAIVLALVLIAGGIGTALALRYRAAEKPLTLEITIEHGPTEWRGR